MLSNYIKTVGDAQINLVIYFTIKSESKLNGRYITLKRYGRERAATIGQNRVRKKYY